MSVGGSSWGPWIVISATPRAGSSSAFTYRYWIALAEESLASGVSLMPWASAGLGSAAARSRARAVTVWSQAVLGTTSSTSRQAAAFLPVTPSGRVEK